MNASSLLYHNFSSGKIKTYCLLIGLSLFLLNTGCSSTYTIRDFSSKEEYYEYFNNSTYDKNLKITLDNDSSFVLKQGINRIAKIEGDSLYLLEVQSLNRGRFNIPDTISFFVTNKVSFKSLYLEKTSLVYASLPDSTITINNIKIECIPIVRLKEVTYKNMLLGIPGPIIFGAASGFIMAAYYNYNYTDLDLTPEDRREYFLYGTGIGAIIGGIVGFITGYEYRYLFNPM